MSMSRKHFKAIAEALRSVRPKTSAKQARQQWLRDRDTIAITLAEFNPRFCRTTFEEATEEERS